MTQLTKIRAEAGRKGGQATARLHKHDREYYQQLGRMGGRPRRLSYSEIMNGGNGK